MAGDKDTVNNLLQRPEVQEAILRKFGYGSKLSDEPSWLEQAGDLYHQHSAAYDEGGVKGLLNMLNRESLEFGQNIVGPSGLGGVGGAGIMLGPKLARGQFARTATHPVVRAAQDRSARASVAERSAIGEESGINDPTLRALYEQHAQELRRLAGTSTTPEAPLRDPVLRDRAAEGVLDIRRAAGNPESRDVFAQSGWSREPITGGAAKEVSDVGAKLVPMAESQTPFAQRWREANPGSNEIGDLHVWEHPAGDVHTEFGIPPVRFSSSMRPGEARRNRDTNEITAGMRNRYGPAPGDITRANAALPHEVQHIAQAHSGWPEGFSPFKAPMYKDYWDAIEAPYPTDPAIVKMHMSGLLNQWRSGKMPEGTANWLQDFYERFPGEIQARDVQARRAKSFSYQKSPEDTTSAPYGDRVMPRPLVPAEQVFGKSRTQQLPPMEDMSMERPPQVDWGQAADFQQSQRGTNLFPSPTAVADAAGKVRHFGSDQEIADRIAQIRNDPGARKELQSLKDLRKAIDYHRSSGPVDFGADDTRHLLMTPDKVAEFHDLRAQRLPMPEIANRMGIQQGTLNNWLNRNPDVARYPGARADTPRHEWTPEQLDKLNNHVAMGTAIPKIAEDLGLGYHQVWHRLNRAPGADRYRGTTAPEEAVPTAEPEGPGRGYRPTPSMPRVAALERPFNEDMSINMRRLGPPTEYGEDQTHRFALESDKGLKGQLEISHAKNDPSHVFVDSIHMRDPKQPKVDSWLSGINQVGSRDIHDLLHQVTEQFPEAEKISGYRVTGAREGKAQPPGTSSSGLVTISLKNLKKYSPAALMGLFGLGTEAQESRAASPKLTAAALARYGERRRQLLEAR